MRVLRYLSALDHRRMALWCAGIWYAAVAVRLAEREASPWLRSLGLATIVGIILALNAAPRGGRIRDLGFWPVFRFFLIPFCVASFSAFTKGHAFFLIFPTNVAGNAAPAGTITLFCAIVWAAKNFSPP